MENEYNPLDLQVIKKDMIETGIIAENQLEEDVLQYMPIIREIIKSGRDVDEPFNSIANTLGLTPTRFKRLYTAVKKEMQMQTELRGGPDIRLELIQDRDIEIKQIRQQKQDFIEKHKNAIVKFEDMDRRRKIAIEEGKEFSEEMPPYELVYVYMKPDVYYKTLKGFDDAVEKHEQAKEKISGVLIQKKDIVQTGAAVLLAQLFEGKNPMERPTVVDTEYIEVEEATPFVSLKDE